MNILLVEDDPGIGRFVSRGLIAEGHAVEWLRTGADARGRLAAGRIDVLVLDLGLPDMDGAVLCAELRAAESDLPVCMLTAKATLEEKLEGFAAGADDYLAKPFAFAELLARLTALGRRPRAEPVRIGALRIDPARRQAWLGEPALALAPREYDLLAVLAAAGGAIVPRDRLIDAVWGREAEVSANLLDVYIGYLRRRLTPGPDVPRLVTERGRGFALVLSDAGAAPRS